LWTVDEQARTLELRAFSDESLATEFPVHRLGFDEGGAAWAAADRAPIEVEDVVADGRLVEAAWCRRHGLTSFLAVPLMLDDAPVGVLAFYGRQPFRMRREDMDLLDVVLAQSALALRNAQLFGAAQSEIAERRRVEAALRESEERYRALVDNLKEVVFQADARGTWTFLNGAWTAMTGFEPAESLSRPILDALHPEDRPRLAEAWDRLATGGEETSLEARVLTRAGGVRWVEVHARPRRDEQGRLTGATGLLNDITERKSADLMKDEFLATVSHELRTPLAAIRGHIELVLEEDAGPITPLQQQFLTVAFQSTDRLGALINDLLDVSKIEAGRVQLRKAPLDLADVLREVAATFRLEAERAGLAFECKIPELPPVVGDRDRLIQLFGNLVANAIKYTLRGTVRLEAAAGYGQAEVTVTDTGVGISAEDQRQLFSKFFRSRDRVVGERRGTGLGLVIAKGFAEAHGGTIAVESEPGRGSRFLVTLPALSPETRGAEPGRPGQPTILVVDDEAAIRDLFLEYVAMWGYHGVGAGDGGEALELARRLAPDLIILDVLMPPPDGLEVLRRLKADPTTRDIPVVVNSVADDPAEVLRLGAAECLMKPSHSSRVRDVVEQCLRRDRPAEPGGTRG
jgi:PAS domain S-box-containing protein